MKSINAVAWRILASMFLACGSPSTLAQAAAPPAAPAANPADVATLDAILSATYDVISGPAKAERNWDRFRSLFIPGARLIAAGPRPGGEVQASVRDVEGYIAGATAAFARDGFFESELARRVERFGHIAHVFSTYESRHARDDVKPFQRGINSIQLMFDGKRWWLVTIYWAAERTDNPIPDTYLHNRSGN